MRKVFSILFILSYASVTQGQEKALPDSTTVMRKTATTTSCSYMTPREKKALQWLNIARMYPRWFIKSQNLKNEGDRYHTSLYKVLRTMKPITKKMEPDYSNWLSARCHAESCVKAGKTGHSRIDPKCKKVYDLDAECLHYADVSPKLVIRELLIDQDVPGYGHRKICLDPIYIKVGICFRDYTQYPARMNVFDFGRKKWIPPNQRNRN